MTTEQSMRNLDDQKKCLKLIFQSTSATHVESREVLQRLVAMLRKDVHCIFANRRKLFTSFLNLYTQQSLQQEFFRRKTRSGRYNSPKPIKLTIVEETSRIARKAIISRQEDTKKISISNYRSRYLGKIKRIQNIRIQNFC